MVNGFARDSNFKESIIEIVHRQTDDSRIVDISAALAFESAIKKAVYPEYIWIKKLVLLEDINQHLVLIDRFDHGKYLMSEVIKNEMEAADCTGVRFDPIDS